MGQIAERIAEARRQLELNPELANDKEFIAGLLELDALLAESPWQAFEPHVCRTCKTYDGVGCPDHRTPQLDWFRAVTKIIAAFAGNQFGKTTGLVIKADVECVPPELIPPQLKEFRTVGPGPCYGWIFCPTEEKIFDSLLPAFQEWTPKRAWAGGVFDKAWNGSRLMLSFSNGSTINFKTYKQHPSTLGGARLHWVGYDEPPPREHRDEAMTRLLRYGGYEMFAMTPLKTNTGWIRRDIFKKRESLDITVIKASMHDNPLLDEKTKQHILAQYESDLWRRAREFGDFVDVGGLIYTDFEDRVIPRPSGDHVRSLDPCVSIDPGVRNAGFTFGGFDSENTLGVYDELLIQDGTPDDYATGISEKLKRWGIPRDKVSFVIDPAARARAQVNAETVEGALARLGIYCIHGQNDVEAGVQQIRSRIQHKRIWISEECVGLRDEADEYAAEDRPDGEFKPIKQNDHRLDSLRYMAMYRPFDAVSEAQAPEQNLGWQPGADKAPPAEWLRKPSESPPMGAMS